MIERFSVENFGCIRGLECRLTPLHAFIGPNDSGKTTLLRALQWLAVQARIGMSGDDSGLSPLPRAYLTESPPTRLRGRWRGGAAYEFALKAADVLEETLTVAAPVSQKRHVYPGRGSSLVADNLAPDDSDFMRSGASFLHIDPRAARQPTELYSSERPLGFLDEAGAGLAPIYQELLGRDVDVFVRLKEEFRQLFPSVEKLQTVIDKNKKVSLGIEVEGGRKISPSGMSAGMIYFLAFAAMRYLNQGGLLLVEEPENGLHPARIAEVVRILRHVSRETQVIVATHSPLVINELSGDEVSVVTRSAERGTQVTPLRDTFNYAERSRFYSNGELWLLHSDGVDEHDLLHEPAPARAEGAS